MTPARLEAEIAPGVWAVCVLLISGTAKSEVLIRRLVATGARVEVISTLLDGIDRLVSCASGIAHLVIECDHAGGDDVGRQAFRRLATASPRLLVSLVVSECLEQTFPSGPEAPYHLRAPPSSLALQIVFELAFRTPAKAPRRRKGGDHPDAAIST